MNEDTLMIDGLEDALIGVCMTWHGNMMVERAIYSGELIVEHLVETSEMTEEEAIEYIDFNIIGAYIGETTPIIMWPIIEDLDA